MYSEYTITNVLQDFPFTIMNRIKQNLIDLYELPNSRLTSMKFIVIGSLAEHN